MPHKMKPGKDAKQHTATLSPAHDIRNTAVFPSLECQLEEPACQGREHNYQAACNSPLQSLRHSAIQLWSAMTKALTATTWKALLVPSHRVTQQTIDSCATGTVGCCQKVGDHQHTNTQHTNTNAGRVRHCSYPAIM